MLFIDKQSIQVWDWRLVVFVFGLFAYQITLKMCFGFVFYERGKKEDS